jgi:hypothetical protein
LLATLLAGGNFGGTQRHTPGLIQYLNAILSRAEMEEFMANTNRYGSDIVEILPYNATRS